VCEKDKKIGPIVPEDLESLERELAKGLVGPAREISAEEWKQKAAEIVKRYSRKGEAPPGSASFVEE
jgi:hypothetical protein